MTVPPVLEARALSYRWPSGQDALLGVDLAVRPGGALAILGRSGAGKTTLLRLLGGQLAPTAGEVRLAGAALDPARRRTIHRELGFVFQDPDDGLLGPSACEDAALGPRQLGLPPRDCRARAEEALALAGAAHLADRPVHELSFGERKRVAIAGALALAPRVLVLDEPTAGLDPEAAHGLARTLADLRRERALAVVLGTHDVDLAPALADEVLVLDGGRPVRRGCTGAALADVEALARAGLRPPVLVTLAARLQALGLRLPPPWPLDPGEMARRVLEAMGASAR